MCWTISTILFDIRRCLRLRRCCRCSSALAIIWLGQYFCTTRGGERILWWGAGQEYRWWYIITERQIDVVSNEMRKQTRIDAHNWYTRHSSPSFHLLMYVPPPRLPCWMRIPWLYTLYYVVEARSPQSPPMNAPVEDITAAFSRFSGRNAFWGRF